MPASAPTQPNNAVILERIENMRADITEIKDIVKCADARQQAFEVTYSRSHAEVIADVEALEEHYREHENRIKELEKALQPLVMMNKILAALGSILLVSIVGLVWSVLTHQIQIGVP